MTTNLPLKLNSLPKNLPLDGAVRIELAEGLPIFRASSPLQEKIETLIAKQKKSTLTSEEEKELDEYEELNDYLNLVNKTMRSVLQKPLHGTVIRYDDPFEPAVPIEDWELLQ